MSGDLARALTIAGSDSGGGAGIQADLKTFAAYGVYGASVITSVTAQNTVGVAGAHHLPPEFVAQQLEAVLADIPFDAAKTGMLPNPEITEVVASKLREYGVENLVVDPVMISTSGHRLMEESGVKVVKEALFPLAKVATPNLREAEVLSGIRVTSIEEMKDAARRIRDLGPRFVLVKGGHLIGNATDILYDGEAFHQFSAARVKARPLHGTGCTLSAAIAAGLALGRPVWEAVRIAKDYISEAIGRSMRVGKGFEVLDHAGVRPRL